MRRDLRVQWKCSCGYGGEELLRHRRLGVQLQTIATDFQRISKIHDRVFIGLSVRRRKLSRCVLFASSLLANLLKVFAFSGGDGWKVPALGVSS